MSINVAIAQALGWQWHGEPDWDRTDPYWKKGDVAYQFLPNYCASLDLMATAEATLDQSQRVDYLNELARVCGTEKDKVFATAAQRAMAFYHVRKLGTQ